MREFTEDEIHDVEAELFRKRIIGRIPARTVARAVLANRESHPVNSHDYVCVSRSDLAEVLWHSNKLPIHASQAAARIWASHDNWPGALAGCPDQTEVGL